MATNLRFHTHRVRALVFSPASARKKEKTGPAGLKLAVWDYLGAGAKAPFPAGLAYGAAEAAPFHRADRVTPMYATSLEARLLRKDRRERGSSRVAADRISFDSGSRKVGANLRSG